MNDIAIFHDIIKEYYDGETEDFVMNVLQDYWISCISRELSFTSRKEVLTGKAKFGITGDGKEIPQVALARVMQKGDFRSGYYRDQTLMLALGLSTVDNLFAQLYADVDNDPFSKGRQMNSHFATPFVDEKEQFLNLTDRYNISSDMSCTGGQMARGLGLALASKKFRHISDLSELKNLSLNGDEIVICTIGDASTSEGVFWETINAAAVMQVPLAVCVWDDGYGISVPTELQTAKGNISKALAGFQRNENDKGIDIYTAKGWDYPSLVEMFAEGLEKVRKEHVPALFHVKELTQPQGHSTSGSHERYKSKERLQWEADHDGLQKMTEWMLSAKIATKEQIEKIQEEAKNYVKERRRIAYSQSKEKSVATKSELINLYNQMKTDSTLASYVEGYVTELNNMIDPSYSDVVGNARKLAIDLNINKIQSSALSTWVENEMKKGLEEYETNLYAEGENSILNVPVVPPVFSQDSKKVNGFQLLNEFFDKKFESDKRLIAFGEDVGHIGDVNQGFVGLQEKYGVDRIFDTGIREWTIVGQAIGLAQRGLRPIAEIQYLDYLPYAMSALMDDLATLRYRSGGIQICPAIIRTRGHRLEGVWHSGSPIGMLINSMRGILLGVPRNMTQAAGMYNTLLQGNDPGIVIECLNGYRLKETLPNNTGEYNVPFGIPEILEEGNDVTLVTYGSCVRIAEKAVEYLKDAGINVELIDVQTLLPFDINHMIVNSLKKTNKIIFLDEDVPGGATSYMLQQVLEVQGGYRYLDAAPVTITASANRPPFGNDGDYFCKPNEEDIIEKVFGMMRDYNPQSF